MRQWPAPAAQSGVSERGDGLESVKKTHQVGDVGMGAIRIGQYLPGQRPAPGTTLFAEPGQPKIKF
jgi:hypothetical protein